MGLSEITMAASGTLYTYPENFRAFKALIAARYSGAKVNVDNSFVFGETNKSDSFLKKFPLGKVPAFESNNGECIFESNAIAMAVANEQLAGKTAIDKAHIVQWMNFADNEILPASCTWIFPILGIMHHDKNALERAKEDVRRALGVLNTHLLPRTFLVGERISLADICVCCTLLHLYQYVLDDGFRKQFQNVNRWFLTMVNQPQVKAVIGEFKLCDKMAQFDGKKFAEMQSKLKGSEKKNKRMKKQNLQPQQNLKLNLLLLLLPPLQNLRIQWMLFPLETLIWMIGKGFILTMMKINQFHTSGKSLTKPITLSGTPNINMLMS